MKREADLFGGNEERIDHNFDSAGRQRRKGKKAAAMLGLVAAMAAVVYLTVTICAWIDGRGQQNAVGTLAGSQGVGENKQDPDNQGGGDSNQDPGSQGGGDSNQDPGSQGGGDSNQDPDNQGGDIADVDGSAVNGSGSLPTGTGEDAVGAAGGVAYSQEELETMLSAAVEQAQKQALTEVQNSIKNSLDAGDRKSVV